ncbi:MAG: hypothetical protein PHP50_10935 [Lachnospiraceae bacterium]|nr:hypothetical protein [Lachnospiraceae bacterium]
MRIDQSYLYQDLLKQTSYRNSTAVNAPETAPVSEDLSKSVALNSPANLNMPAKANVPAATVELQNNPANKIVISEDNPSAQKAVRSISSADLRAISAAFSANTVNNVRSAASVSTAAASSLSDEQMGQFLKTAFQVFDPQY